MSDWVSLRLRISGGMISRRYFTESGTTKAVLRSEVFSEIILR